MYRSYKNTTSFYVWDLTMDVREPTTIYRKIWNEFPRKLQKTVQLHPFPPLSSDLKCNCMEQYAYFLFRATMCTNIKYLTMMNPRRKEKKCCFGARN